jgi:hypothetical protein
MPTRSGRVYQPVRSSVDGALCSGHFRLDGLTRGRPTDPDYLETLHARGRCRCVSCPSCTARVAPAELMPCGRCWACADA